MNTRNKFYSLFFAVLLFCLFHSGNISAQFYSIRTNLVGLATGNLNAEGSMALSTRWSIHLPVQYNPFDLWEDAKLKNITVAPGIRYWMRETYGRGCFFGLHGVFSYFNAGGIFGHRYRYQGTAWGGGLSIGLARPLSRHWNIEFELGGGIVWADWERFRCAHCGRRVGKDSGLRLLPTRTAVNLVYLF
ncbi:DUF3575 domain-containing protein [Bacteroides heparinolyticus]|uniref:DUF3575 domain-containing protein n=1 Tax=Prevotella heparinolytica TaxID=28113 RepID=A0A3P2A9M4_9BACE|nr:DUF3575 domain-containing protein [Bacteroides heparinolyticus]MCF0256786.1 DUF3575 domain-containing protein [Bacteroides heparinolyticus]RRD92081.1 DUF3575 domain-containing protein [Bacteroides heparinolyticus]VFB13933.1 Protein of uncharacterised function (DUF3575) [Bacteroides heparinolyticus]